MIEYRTKIGKTFIGIWLGGDKGNVVLAPGLPQYLDKYHPLVEQVGRLGYNLFVPRYQGTFESSGDFNISSSTKTIEEAVKVVKSGESEDLFNVGKNITWEKDLPLYVVGFSYGALPALLFSEKERISRTVLICPFVDIKQHLGNTSGENVLETYKFLERAYPNIYRINPEGAVKDLTNINLPAEKENLAIVLGSDDGVITAEEIKQLTSRYKNAVTTKKDGGHSIKMEDSLFLKLFDH